MRARRAFSTVVVTKPLNIVLAKIISALDFNENKGLVTEIDQYNRDIRGGKIAPAQQAQLYRMRKWHKRASISNSMERNLAIALTELNRVASHLGLEESIREASALLYRQCVEKGLIRGRQIESVVSAVIYAICRQYCFQVP